MGWASRARQARTRRWGAATRRPPRVVVTGERLAIALWVAAFGIGYFLAGWTR